MAQLVGSKVKSNWVTERLQRFLDSQEAHVHEKLSRHAHQGIESLLKLGGATSAPVAIGWRGGLRCECLKQCLECFSDFRLGVVPGWNKARRSLGMLGRVHRAATPASLASSMQMQMHADCTDGVFTLGIQA